MRCVSLIVSGAVAAAAPFLPVTGQTMDPDRRIGASIAILPGAIWADRNNDGFADGYVYQGLYHAGVPAGYASNQVSLVPKTSVGHESASVSVQASDDYVEGRRLFDAGENRAAAEKLLAFYRYHNTDARAPASLLYLGQALVRLGKPDQACKAYAELAAVYRPATLQNIEYELSKAKASANCPINVSRAPTAQDLRRRWGFYLDLVGKRYFSRVADIPLITTFSWKVPGEVLLETVASATKRGELDDRAPTSVILRWDEARGGIVSPGYSYVYVPQADGSFIFQGPNSRSRAWSVAGGSSWTSVTEQLKGGQWKPMRYGTYEYHEMTPEFIAELRGGGGGFGGFLKGAIAGAAGMAMGASPETATESAIAGAVAGGFLGANGEDAGMIGSAAAEGSARGTAEVEASNSELRRISEQRSLSSTGSAGAGSRSTENANAVEGASNSGKKTAYTYCSLYGQTENGKNWQFYISDVGAIQSGTGEAWPDSPSDPIAKTWGDYLSSQGVNLAIYRQGFPPRLPTCYGHDDPAKAQHFRDNDLSQVRAGSGGYTVHELTWRPSGEQ